jgi:transposase-like protein
VCNVRNEVQLRIGRSGYMPEQTLLTTTVKEAVRRKKAGRKPGQKVYSKGERAVALTIVDLFDGNVARAALATGIERKTLFNWRHELELEAIEMQKAQAPARLSLVAKLQKVAETLSVIALMKTHSASVSEIRQLMEVILDKIERLSKLEYGEIALSALRPTVGQQEPKALPPSFDAERVKAHWESIVGLVIQESSSQGRPMTREEAIAVISEGRPEAKDYLM